MKTIFDKELKDVIKGFSIAIVSVPPTIVTPEQFELIKTKADEIEKATGLQIVITNFIIDSHD
jgi:hypothetical protein